MGAIGTNEDQGLEGSSRKARASSKPRKAPT